MKINTLPPGGMKTMNPNEGSSASPDRLARARAVAQGQDPVAAQAPADRQVERAEQAIKRIKMRTQYSPDRHVRETLPTEEIQTPSDTLSPNDPASPPPTDTLAPDEQAQATSEDTKPLSPQLAAIAKQKRALQLKEQELLAKEKALQAQATDRTSLEEYKARIKANALSVLQEEGVTYDQLTEQILASSQGDSEIAALRAELKAIKEGVEDQKKTLTDREAAAEQQALGLIRREVDQLIAEGDDFEMIREAGYAGKVVDLIHRTWKTTGEQLTERDAALAIEQELLEESLKFARLKKVQSKLAPSPATPTQQSQPVQQDRPNTKVMRTLSNRDGSSSISLSRRQRAIAAMEGRLK